MQVLSSGCFSQKERECTEPCSDQEDRADKILDTGSTKLIGSSPMSSASEYYKVDSVPVWWIQILLSTLEVWSTWRRRSIIPEMPCCPSPITCKLSNDGCRRSGRIHLQNQYWIISILLQTTPSCRTWATKTEMYLRERACQLRAKAIKL